MRIESGRAEVDEMLKSGELKRVTPSLELADTILLRSEESLSSAIESLNKNWLHSSYESMWASVRLALTALLQVQGLRPTSTGGHIAVEKSARAQFDRSMGELLKPITMMRRTRNDLEYPDEDTYIEYERVEKDITLAENIIDACKKALPHLDVY